MLSAHNSIGLAKTRPDRLASPAQRDFLGARDSTLTIWALDGKQRDRRT
jgi:hypothetical protein